MASRAAEVQLVDVDELARDLVKLSANLDRHISTKAREIGNGFGRRYAKAADERIKTITDEAAVEIQRRDDVIAELRRQMKYLERHADRCFRLEKAIKTALYDGHESIAVEALFALMNAPTAPATTIESKER